MNRPENEFWSAKLSKIIKMIDMYSDEKLIEASAMRNEKYQSKYFSGKTDVKEIKSLKEIEGW
jgi:hypothetical protein